MALVLQEKLKLYGVPSGQWWHLPQGARSQLKGMRQLLGAVDGTIPNGWLLGFYGFLNQQVKSSDLSDLYILIYLIFLAIHLDVIVIRDSYYIYIYKYKIYTYTHIPIKVILSYPNESGLSIY